MAIFVAPTEPPKLKGLGKSSSTPEKYGVDFLIPVKGLGLAGIQRKEIKDFIASVHDGRLNKELAQMHALKLRVLLIEGRLKWTRDGELVVSDYTRISRRQFRGLLWSARLLGAWVDFTTTLQETHDYIGEFGRWASKDDHSSLLRRPGPKPDAWGRVTNEAWGIHILTSFPGIGTETARNIVRHFGSVPLGWQVTESELMEVKGIGKGRARKLMEALERGKGE